MKGHIAYPSGHRVTWGFSADEIPQEHKYQDNITQAFSDEKTYTSFKNGLLNQWIMMGLKQPVLHQFKVVNINGHQAIHQHYHHQTNSGETHNFLFYFYPPKSFIKVEFYYHTINVNDEIMRIARDLILDINLFDKLSKKMQKLKGEPSDTEFLEDLDRMINSIQITL